MTELRTYSFRTKGRLPVGSRALVCGLPDSGLVAKIALDHIVEFLGAMRVGDVYSPHLPPQVVVRENGVAELVGHQLYRSPKANLMFYTGDSQPVDGEGAYKLSEFIVRLCRRQRIREIIILAALIKADSSDTSQVVASAARTEYLSEYLALGVGKTSLGSITWMHGLILGEAEKEGVKAVCLSAETRGDLPDPRAASALLKVLERRLTLDLGTSKLDISGDRGHGIVDESRGPPEEPDKGRPPYIG